MIICYALSKLKYLDDPKLEMVKDYFNLGADGVDYNLNSLRLRFTEQI